MTQLERPDPAHEGSIRQSQWIKSRKRTGATCLFAASVVTFLALEGAQAGSALRDYTARDVMIPMRDGVKLYTQIFEPKTRDQSYPILFTRTPYDVGPLPSPVENSSLGPSPLFADAGYIFVYQDVRGQFRSEGEWQMIRPRRLDKSDPQSFDESTDAIDTIDWLLKNVEAHNGRVGMWGISYDAWETVMAMAESHPALLAASPQASPADEFIGDDTHHNGAFRLSYTYAWIAYMSVMRGDVDRALVGPTLSKDAYEFFLEAGTHRELEERYFKGKAEDWNEVMSHGNYDDYWKRRNVLTLLNDVEPAVLNVAGWFDAEDFRGPFDIYHTIESKDEDERNFLVVGPWKHGGWSVKTNDTGESLGDMYFESRTSDRFRKQVEFPFFEFYLRDQEDHWLPEVMAFETGANAWHELDEWPPQSTEAMSLYLHGDGDAAFEAPEGGPDDPQSYSEFVSDPADPVPYSANGLVFPDAEYMVEDQRFVLDRSDVLSFLTDPLDDDLVIAGKVGVELYFSTTGTDADWIVKLIDVYPDDSGNSPATGRSMGGAQIILTGDIFRAKYRDSFEEPSPLEPGQVVELKFALPDRFHCFRSGHRIMVQLHSTWFPIYDRNPQTFVDIYHAEEKDYKVATHRVYHRDGAASVLKLPVFSH